MANNILIVAEGRAEGLRKVSFELVNAARQLETALGGKVEGVVVGSGVGTWAEELARTGISQVYVVDNPALDKFAPESFAAALEQVIRHAQPAVVLFGASGWGKEVSARTAAKLDWGLVTDCIEARVENGELVLKRPIYAGKAISHVKAKVSR